MCAMSINFFLTFNVMDHRVYDSESVLNRSVRIRRREDVSSLRSLFELQDGETRELLLIALMRLRVVFSSDDAIRLRVDRRSDIENLQTLNRRVVEQLETSVEHGADFRARAYKDPWSNGIIALYNVDWRDVVCFDADHVPIRGERCVRDMEMVDAIVYPRFVWMNNAHYGISYRVAQLRRCEPVGLTRCLFAKASSIPIPPPPPPPPPTRAVGLRGTIRISTKAEKRPKNIKTGVLPWTPSLDDILKCRQKLRTTK